MGDQREMFLKVAILALATVILISGAWGYKLKKDRESRVFEALAEEPAAVEPAEEAVLETEETGFIYVDICGAVAKEGFYRLPKESRLMDAVDMAGGLLETADRRRINLAQKIFDQQKIIIMTVDEALVEEAEAKERGLVNINTASAEELERLPGIGPVYAARIIDYREEKGGFSTKEEIMAIQGIGEKTYADLESCICIF